MSQAFNRGSGLMLVEVELSGPAGKAGATLVLDTGATNTALNGSLSRSLGYDPDASTDFARMTTGSTVETVPRLIVNRLSALGRPAVGLRVLAHNLPAEAAVDGLLGLDFFRDLTLMLDFRLGQITLA
jgi:predicted aspartyl protease